MELVAGCGRIIRTVPRRARADDHARPDHRRPLPDRRASASGRRAAPDRSTGIAATHRGGRCHALLDRGGGHGLRTGRWLADHGVAVFAVDYRLARPDRPTWDKAPQDL
ncbi:hypothetical protein ACWC5I_21525, partial [Kitasatospora sp. NPDC001574]